MLKFKKKLNFLIKLKSFYFLHTIALTQLKNRKIIKIYYYRIKSHHHFY